MKPQITVAVHKPYLLIKIRGVGEKIIIFLPRLPILPVSQSPSLPVSQSPRLRSLPVSQSPTLPTPPKLSVFSVTFLANSGILKLDNRMKVISTAFCIRSVKVHNVTSVRVNELLCKPILRPTQKP